MASRILVVDRNEAFATVLEEMLETDGGYQVEVVRSGREAMTSLRRKDFDLTIVDMDLDPDEMDYRGLIRNLRRILPTMRLMLIPLMGGDLPPDALQLGIQGTLSKPFFADDLLPRIKEALAKPIDLPSRRPPSTSAPRRAEPRPAAKPAAKPKSVAKPAADIQSALSELAREINADAVLLLAITDGEGSVVAHVTTLNESRVETLASLSAAAVQAGGSIASFWGQRDALFEHNMFESQSLRFYIMALPEDHLIVVVTPISTQLGTIRYNLRRTARTLARLTLT